MANNQGPSKEAQRKGGENSKHNLQRGRQSQDKR